MSDLVKLTPRLAKRDLPGGETLYFVHCPGCGHPHMIPTPRWDFNGSLAAPTFIPSVRLFYVNHETKAQITTCHFNVTNGQIVFHGDCPHAFKNKTIDLAPIDDKWLAP